MLKETFCNCRYPSSNSRNSRPRRSHQVPLCLKSATVIVTFAWEAVPATSQLSFARMAENKGHFLLMESDSRGVHQPFPLPLPM